MTTPTDGWWCYRDPATTMGHLEGEPWVLLVEGGKAVTMGNTSAELLPGEWGPQLPLTDIMSGEVLMVSRAERAREADSRRQLEEAASPRALALVAQVRGLREAIRDAAQDLVTYDLTDDPDENLAILLAKLRFSYRLRDKRSDADIARIMEGVLMVTPLEMREYTEECMKNYKGKHWPNPSVWLDIHRGGAK